MVDGVLYVSNGVGLAVAIDPENGRTLWTQKVDEPILAGQALRGVAYWGTGPDSRILTYRGRYLYALNPKTGVPIPSFGERGRVDFDRDLGSAPNGDGPRNHPAIRHLNLGPLGHAVRTSALATRTLLSVTEGDQITVRTPPGGGGQKIRALGAPMTYLHKGKQYFVVAIGGQNHPAEFVALSLP